MLTVILAGGGSRRMGRDKALLPYGKTTLLQYQIDKYKSLGPVAVSVNCAGKFPFTGAVELVDLYPDCGPLNGIVSGFANTDETELFLTAVDLPHGDTKLVRRLAALRGDADICIIRSGQKGIEPLFAVYGRRCADAAKVCLADGRKSVTDIFEALHVRYMLPDELPEFDLAHILTNVNTPDEYKLLMN